MKNKLLLFVILISTCSFAQSKFSVGVGSNQQFLKSDSGLGYDVFISYNVHTDIAIHVTGSHANLESKDFDFEYNMNKYSLSANYDFAKSEKSKLESVFGFSYLNLDKKLLLDKKDGLGIDLGIKATFGLKNNFNYGFKIVSTYSNIAPGGLLAAGIFLKYDL